MRFSLRWLFAAVAFVAIGCASLVYASRAVNNAVAAVTYGFLAFCALGAFYARRERRPFWGGCAIVGILYFAGSPVPGNLPTPASLTEAALGAVFPFAQHEIAIPGPRGPTWGAHERDGVWYTLAPQWEIFRDTGQFVAVLILALVGGAIAKRLAGATPPLS